MNDDKLNKNLDAYLESFVVEGLAYCKPEDEEKVRSYFYNAIIDSVIDNLNEEQLTTIKENMSNMPILLEKIELFTNQMPAMAGIIEKKLEDSLNKIKENPGIIG